MATHTRFSLEDGARFVEYTFGLSLDSYLQWCRANGFSVTCEKTKVQLQKEHGIYRTAIALNTFEKRRKEKKTPAETLRELACASPIELRDSRHKLALYVPKDSDTKKAFIELVDACDSNNKDKILSDEKSIRVLLRLAIWYPYWVRIPSEWKSPSHSLSRQMGSLIRHLFAKYKMPEFFDSVWENDDTLQQEWYIHVGAGNNIRTARRLPFPLTKAMAHHFLEAPISYSVLDAFVHGQVLALKGDRCISQNLRGTKILSMDDEFRQSFIRFLVDNPMLDTRQYGPILDYIHEQKYAERTVHRGDGTWVRQPPPQPNFSMHGRNPETLMGQVERWHRELNNSKRGGKLKWGHSQYENFKVEEGQACTNTHKQWSVVELTSSQELLDEGRAMYHCVSSYAQSCASGRCTIWSLRLVDCKGSWRLVTMEVSRGTIVQARGIRNRKPTQQEWRVIKLWASKNHITTASYVQVQ